MVLEWEKWFFEALLERQNYVVENETSITVINSESRNVKMFLKLKTNLVASLSSRDQSAEELKEEIKLNFSLFQVFVPQISNKEELWKGTYDYNHGKKHVQSNRIIRDEQREIASSH